MINPMKDDLCYDAAETEKYMNVRAVLTLAVTPNPAARAGAPQMTTLTSGSLRSGPPGRGGPGILAAERRSA